MPATPMAPWPFALPLLLALLGAAPVDEPRSTVSGAVVSASGPVVGARVRVRGTPHATRSAQDGSFSLTTPGAGRELEIAAWAAGHYTATIPATPPASGLKLTLRRLHATDNADYTWISPFSQESPKACSKCHPDEFGPLPEWRNNAHGRAISNPRFFSLYNGTDLAGQPAGAGFLGQSREVGLCATCHAPAAATNPDLQVDMNRVRGQLTAGIHCDFCHKVGGLVLNPATASVFPRSPGIRSLRLLRPPPGDDVFFGPYDDVNDPDTFLPEISQSAFCAPCHQLSLKGTPIYTSYAEWLASPYAEQGVSCQDCHMPPSGEKRFALPEKGGLERPPESIPSHLQLGATNAEFLKGAVEVALAVRRGEGRMWASVIITNKSAGHHFPTDFPGRHLILVVSATDGDGRTLELEHGPTVPDWGGPEAGLPGKAFAKVLRDLTSGESPTVSYWNQTIIESDNRIPAYAKDVSKYGFAAPARTVGVRIEARLIFRRLFHALAEQKRWDSPDILLAEVSAQPSM